LATKNLIDDTSTTVSAATPGAELDLRYRTTLTRAAWGVPVRFWVYAASSVANDTGVVQILDSAGSAKLTIPITGTTARWYVTDGYLPATDAKYDPHRGGNTTGTLDVYAFTVLEYADISTGVTITKSGGTAGAWGDSGVSSVETIAGDGRVECIASDSGFRVMGLSVTDSDTNWTSITHGLSFAGTSDTRVFVVEAGATAYTLVGGKEIGDVLSIERFGEKVFYKINGTTFYSSLTASTGSVRIDTAFHGAGAVMPRVRLYDVGDPVTLTWQNSTNVTIT